MKYLEVNGSYCKHKRRDGQKCDVAALDVRALESLLQLQQWCAGLNEEV